VRRVQVRFDRAPRHRDICAAPPRAGKYPINPRVHAAEIVPTSILTRCCRPRWLPLPHTLQGLEAVRFIETRAEVQESAHEAITEYLAAYDVETRASTSRTSISRPSSSRS
jgi:hypothetical protein